MSDSIIIGILISILALVTLIFLKPLLLKFFQTLFKKSKHKLLGETTKIRIIKQVTDAVLEMSKRKIGALITLVNNDKIDSFRTDGIKINSDVSAALILSIFNKKSPLHDGAMVIDDGKITFVATFYKISAKSIDTKFGARHRAAIGISEETDSLTIVVSEQTGAITFTRNSEMKKIKNSEIQEKLNQYLI